MPGQDRTNQYLRRSMSFSGDAIRQTTYADDYTVRGRGFLLQRNFTINNGATLNILIDYTGYDDIPDDGLGLIFVLPPYYSTTAGPVTVTVSRDSDYSGGTEIQVPNLNTTVGGTSQTIWTSGATGTDAGTSVLEYLVGSSSTNQNSGGGSIQKGSPFIIDNTAKTLVQILNSSGEQITFNYSQTFFEI